MTSIQFIQVTPEQLQNAIVEGVKKELEILKTNFQPKEPSDLLTRNETAQLLKVDLSTLHNWVKRKKIRAYGISHRVYFKRSEIEEILTPIN